MSRLPSVGKAVSIFVINLIDNIFGDGLLNLAQYKRAFLDLVAN